TGLASEVKSLGVYWFLFLALHRIKCAFHVRSGGTRCKVFALLSPFTVSNFWRFLWCGFFEAGAIFAKIMFLCRCCSSSKPVSFANLKAVKKGS
ncbi:hypothetical protein, partial [Vibrio parahaemolyticus]|uniref:hypothetical protein n=1 Tax=Vibrio parahaemolyticus TaxID=670 RepID=UPI00215BA598